MFHDQLFASALALSLCACGTAPYTTVAPAPTAKESAKPSTPPRLAADVNRLRTAVVWLADDAREGRRAGTASARLAADWLVGELSALGLEPAGEDRTFLQSFQVPLQAEEGPNSAVVASGAAEPWTARSPHVAPLFCAESGTARGALVFRGYGMVVETQRWNDFAGERLDGAIAVVLRGTPPDSALVQPPASGNEEVAHTPSWESGGSIFNKVMTAKRFGAVAVLLVQREEDAKALPFDPSQPARAGIPALSVTWNTFERLAGADRARELRDRASRRDETWGDAAVASAVEVSADVRREKGPAFNVLARLRGIDEKRTVLVGAHYDHLGRGGEGSLAPKETGAIHNGADDNASGTAAVLEIARVLARGPQPQGDVVFALWSGEELGLLGSEHWMQHPTIELANVRANLNLDMVGRALQGSPAPETPPRELRRTLTVLGVGTAEPFAGWMEELGRDNGLEILASASGQGIGGSDHMSFMKRKIPVLHLFTGVHADYHKPSDDSDKIDFEGLRRATDFGVACVRRMQDAPSLAWVEPPERKEAADQKPAAAASGFRVWFGTVPEYSYEGPGLKLAGTSAGSPAEKAGMLAGDVLVQVGDIEIGTIHDFVYALSVYKPGDVVLAKFLRDGAEQSVRITLATRQQE
jgi:hypothetical protein